MNLTVKIALLIYGLASTNFVPTSENHRPLNEVAQFAKIARPVICLHRFQGLPGKAPKLLSCSLSEKIEMPFRNPFQVLRTLSQWR